MEHHDICAFPGVVAMGAIVIGGAKYMTSVGNPSSIEDAKNTIYQAIYGLILALASWVIISTINPDILFLKKPAMLWSGGVYAPIAKDPLAMCASGPQGDGITIACSCADNKQVYANPVLPPYIVSISPTPCSANVSTSTSSLTVTFSVPMDASTIIASNFVSMGGVFLFTVLPDTTNTEAILTLVQPLTNPGIYELGIKKDIKSAKSAGGVKLTSDFILKFNTDGTVPSSCTSLPVSTGSGCSRVCSDPNFAQDGNYHCMKADLRLGKTGDIDSYSKTVGDVKVNEIVFFDARSHSIDYAWPDLNTNVPATDPFFNNGIGQYVISYFPAPFSDTQNKLKSGNMYSYKDEGDCTDWATKLFSSLFSSTPGIEGLAFPTAGQYKLVLNVLSKKGCLGPAVDTVFVNVVP